MSRTLTLGLLALAVLFAGLAMPVAAQDTGDAPTNESTSNQSAVDGLSLGEQLSAVMSAQQAEISGELDQQAFQHKLKEANSSEERAELLAQRVNETRERVQDLKEERKELREKYQNGSISRAEYVSELSALGVQHQNTVETVNQTAEEAKELPSDTLQQHGVNVSAIKTLKQNASEMSGPAVAAVAQSIAGDTPADAGPGQKPDGVDRGNTSDGSDRGADTRGDNQTTDARSDIPTDVSMSKLTSEDTPLDVTLKGNSIPSPGDNATVAVTYDGQPLEGVTVSVNGETVGTTDANGELAFTVPTDVSLPVNMTVSTDTVTVKLSYDLGSGLSIDSATRTNTSDTQTTTTDGGSNTSGTDRGGR